MKTTKRLEPQVWNKIHYVKFQDIREFHGKEWYKKWINAFGPGNTCPVIEDGKMKAFDACYHSDYTRFADVVDLGKPTYWD